MQPRFFWAPLLQQAVTENTEPPGRPSTDYSMIDITTLKANDSLSAQMATSLPSLSLDREFP